MSLFQRKSIEDVLAFAKESKLTKSLGVTQLTLLGIGCIIGTGIFVLTGKAAANYAGPALVLSFVIAGLACLFAGLCYGEFASMVPISGSAYTYAYVAFGEIIAWTVGWCLCLEYLVSSSVAAVGWSGYFASLFGGKLPKELLKAPFDVIDNKLQATGGIINIPAMLIVGIISSILYFGIKQSTRFNNFIVFIKLFVIIAFILVGVNYINPDNWDPFIPAAQGDKYGWGGISVAAGVIFFAYIGFDAVSTAAQEAKNPQKDLPKGMIYSLLICTVLYILMSLVLTGMAKYTELGVDAPIARALEIAAPNLLFFTNLVKIGAIAGLTSVVLVLLLGQARIFMGMANDGLVPKSLAKVHPKYKTPHVATITCFLISAPMAGLLPLNILGELVSMGTLLAFSIVCIGVFVLRHTKPEWNRPYKTPVYWLVCPLGAGFCGWMMYKLPLVTWGAFGIWMLIGFAVYFGYSYRHSVLRNR